MFTLEQIQLAHSKVKSGADFPAYIQELKSLGVLAYTTYVRDGRVDYQGHRGQAITSSAKYSALPMAEHLDMAMFETELKAHQQGKTNYQSFIQMCANTGIHHWKIDMANMTCTYFDEKGRLVLQERISTL